MSFSEDPYDIVKVYVLNMNTIITNQYFFLFVFIIVKSAKH